MKIETHLQEKKKKSLFRPENRDQVLINYHMASSRTYQPQPQSCNLRREQSLCTEESLDFTWLV